MSKYYELLRNNEINIVISKYGYGKIYHEVKKLQKENKRLHTIIKEAREFIENNQRYYFDRLGTEEYRKRYHFDVFRILHILDKENEK